MRPFFGRLLEFVERYWVGALLLVGTIILVSFPLWYQLGHLTGGLTESEMFLRRQVNDNQISPFLLLHDPFFLPYKLGLFILQYIPLTGGGSLRAISAFLGLAGIIGFYLVVRIWQTRRLAVLGTLLFATSSWLLHVARHASIDSMYLFLFLIVAAWVWVKQGSYPRLAFIFVMVCTILGLYVPGFVWFIIPAIIWQRKTIAKAFNRIPYSLMWPMIVFAVIVLIPLFTAFVSPSAQATTIGNIKEFFGLPSGLPSLIEILRNLASIPLQIFVISPANNLLSVGRLPLLDIFTSAMVIIGFVNLASNWRLDRAKIVIVSMLIGTVLVSLGGPVHISILLPFLYLLAAEGIGYLLHEWLSTFPRNPFARSVGLIVISAAVAVACAYQLTSYFVAWPHTNIVKSSFTEHP